MYARIPHSAAALRRERKGLEYGFYFALVFAISLVPALARMIVPPRGRARRFFVTDAWSRAGEVTPMIFQAL